MEIWKDIPGYEGVYQASNIGRIRSVEGKATSNARFKQRRWKSRIIRPKGCADYRKSGYRVALWKNGKPRDWLVARLVALTWIPGYEPGFTVNHIDGDRLNNQIDNLEWLSLSENIKHGFNTGLYSSIQKPVIITLPNGEEIGFASRAAASRYLGKTHGYVSGCLKRRNPYYVDGLKYPACKDDVNG